MDLISRVDLIWDLGREDRISEEDLIGDLGRVDLGTKVVLVTN